jgi:2'-5' RNA ligase
MKSDLPCRCFIALLPPLEIQEYANQVIGELGDRYQTRTSKSPPHVTLQPPFQWHMQDISKLEQILSEFANHQRAVPMTLSGFGAFVPRVLYINVLTTAELLALQTALMTHLQETLEIIDPKSKGRTFAPHLTVASRNVTRQTFKQAWTELQVRQVEFEFVGDRLTLLVHDGQRWQIRSEFPLGQ